MTLRYLAHLSDSIRTLWYLHTCLLTIFVPAVLTIFKKFSGSLYFPSYFSMVCLKSSILIIS